MISVIVCTRNPHENAKHKLNVSDTIGTDFEYIMIDNSENIYNLCSAYNEGIKRAKGNIFVFVHDDVFFLEPHWGNVLMSKFEDPHIGLIGLAGTKHLFNHNPLWISAGQPYLRGRVVQEFVNEQKAIMTVFNWDKTDAEVVAVDGLFFATPAKVFNDIKFDAETFNEFHFYDLDISMQIGKKYKIIVTWDILVKHLSVGSINKSWEKFGKAFIKKYKNHLPITTKDIPPPDPNIKRPGPMNYPLK